MKGYAIDVRLMEWKKSDGHETVFKELKCHYLGTFSSQTAEMTYKKLGTILSSINLKVGTKMRAKKRGSRP